MRENPSWLDVYRWLLGGSRYLKTATSPCSLPQIGELTAFLIAADIAYTGLIEMPSPHDVGIVIKELKKGPLHAMQKLGCVDLQADGETVANAFSSLCDKAQIFAAQLMLIPSYFNFDPL